MRILISLILLVWPSSLQSCENGCAGCGSPPPPPAVKVFSAFYRTLGNADLLNPNTPGAYKQEDIHVTSKVDIGGTIKEIDYNELAIKIEYSDVVNRNYFLIAIPTSYNKKPIATHVRLTPSVVDTITYTFTNASIKYPYQPEFIYYNKQLIWELSKVKSDEIWSLTIVKN
jgi:hypothetical protein